MSIIIIIKHVYRTEHVVKWESQIRVQDFD